MDITAVLKYFGNRSRESKILLQAFFGARCVQTLYEPFCGSCAFSISCLNKEMAENYILNDSYQSLVKELYSCFYEPREVIDNFNHHIAILRKLERHEQQFSYYEKIKATFNQNPKPGDFLFLNNFTKFHVPLIIDGKYCSSFQASSNIDLEINFLEQGLLELAQLAKQSNIRLHAKSFTEIIGKTTQNDLVFLDPPYPNLPNDLPIYHQPDVPAVLHYKLCNLLNQLNDNHTPFILLYGTIGVAPQYVLNPKQYKVKHFLIYNHKPNNLVTESLEFCYISEQLVSDIEAIIQDKTLPLLPYDKFIGMNQYEAMLMFKLQKPNYGAVINKVDEQYMLANTCFILDNKLFKVSPREWQIINYLKKGFSAKQTAYELDISPRTVEAYLDNMRRRANCRTKIHLANKLKFVTADI